MSKKKFYIVANTVSAESFQRSGHTAPAGSAILANGSSVGCYAYPDLEQAQKYAENLVRAGSKFVTIFEPVVELRMPNLPVQVIRLNEDSSDS